MYWHAFWSYRVAAAGAAEPCSPAAMYTTTQRSELPGPVTTVSVVIGVGCSFTHAGSFAMSMGFIFGGVPVKVTRPLMAPALAAAPITCDRTSTPSTSTTAAEINLGGVRIGGSLLNERGMQSAASLPTAAWSDRLELTRMRRQPRLPEHGLRCLQRLHRSEEVDQIPGLHR